MEAAQSVQVMPNPMGDFSMVRFPLGVWDLEVMDVQGASSFSVAFQAEPHRSCVKTSAQGLRLAFAK